MTKTLTIFPSAVKLVSSRASDMSSSTRSTMPGLLSRARTAPTSDPAVLPVPFVLTTPRRVTMMVAAAVVVAAAVAASVAVAVAVVVVVAVTLVVVAAVDAVASEVVVVVAAVAVAASAVTVLIPTPRRRTRSPLTTKLVCLPSRKRVALHSYHPWGLFAYPARVSVGK